ncbi:MAG TPA: hypothetical protein VGL81_28090 [Polyangiaceae bacterium]
MAVDLGAVAQELFEGVMAPLVLGGPVRPGHAIGARAALALGAGDRTGIDPDLEADVFVARIRRARRLAPIDRVATATPAEWTLAAAFHDVLQAANPIFDAALRRSAAARILALAREAIECVPEPANVLEALSRHTWFARVLDVARTDTTVSWWSGSRTYLGVEAPRRLQAWPDLRRVNVVATPHPLLELSPLAVDRARLTDAVALFLTRTPLTEIATCTREAPPFTWGPASLALLATRPGRTLALRVLARLPAAPVDGALGRATRELLATRGASGAPAVTLLAERALARAAGHAGRPENVEASRNDASFARGLGAVAAVTLLDAPGAVWPENDRRRLLDALDAAARSPAAQEAAAMLGERA